MNRIPAEQEYGFTPQVKGAACGTCKRFSYRLNTCTRIGEQRAPINIAAWALLALTGVVILGIALLAIITTVVNFSRCYRFRGYDGE